MSVTDASVCAATVCDWLWDAILTVVTLWWFVIAMLISTDDVTAESNLATAISGGLDTSVLTLLALSHWGALSLLALDITVSVALAVCALLW